MRIAAPFILIVLSSYFLESQFNRPLIQTKTVIGDCQYKLYPLAEDQDQAQRCIYCVPTEAKQIAFRIDQLQKSQLSIQELYQYECRKHLCRDVVNATDYRSFPALGLTQESKIFLYNYSFTRMDNTKTTHMCDEYSCSTILQVDLSKKDSNVYNYAFLIKSDIQNNLNASYYQKDNYKYVNDTIFQVISLILILYLCKLDLNNDRTQVEYLDYIYKRKGSIIVSTLFITQPLRIMNISDTLRQFEWLISGGTYVISELYIYFIILQIIQISKNFDPNQSQKRNQIFISLLIIPYVLERLYLQYYFNMNVILEPLVELDGFITLVQINIVLLNYFTALIVYDLFVYKDKSPFCNIIIMKQNIIYLVSLVYSGIYYKKMSFYIFNGLTELYLFDPTIQITIAGFFIVFFVMSLQQVEVDGKNNVNSIYQLLNQQQPQNDMGQAIKLYGEDQETFNVNREDEQNNDEDQNQDGSRNNLDQDIAEYYMKQADQESKDETPSVIKQEAENDVLL